MWLRKRCRSCSSKSFFFKVKRSLFMCGHVSCNSFAAGLASVSQFVGPRLLKDTPSLVYRRSCRSTLRFARVGSASEACRKRVGSASKPRRNRVGTASELTESEPSRNRVGKMLAPEWASIYAYNRWPVLCRHLVVLSGLRNGEPDGMPDSFSSPAQTSAVTNGATLLRSLLAPRPV